MPPQIAGGFQERFVEAGSHSARERFEMPRIKPKDHLPEWRYRMGMPQIGIHFMRRSPVKGQIVAGLRKRVPSGMGRPDCEVAARGPENESPGLDMPDIECLDEADPVLHRRLIRIKTRDLGAAIDAEGIDDRVCKRHQQGDAKSDGQHKRDETPVRCRLRSRRREYGLKTGNRETPIFWTWTKARRRQGSQRTQPSLPKAAMSTTFAEWLESYAHRDEQHNGSTPAY
jgi:hypothetical protein